MKRTVLAMILLSSLCAVYGQETTPTRTGAIPAGYGNAQWGSLLTEARNKIRGKLVFTDEKTLIISREDGMENLEYYYGFFYIDPAAESGGPGAGQGGNDAGTAAEGRAKATEGKLFYVELKFPYIAMEDVLKKIEATYGTYTDKNLVNNRGALAWKSDSTVIIMWVDQYQNRPYCRKITYVDRKITKELGDYRTRLFRSHELAILRAMSL